MKFNTKLLYANSALNMVIGFTLSYLGNPILSNFFIGWSALIFVLGDWKHIRDLKKEITELKQVDTPNI